jgi:hypothetical protein
MTAMPATDGADNAPANAVYRQFGMAPGADRREELKMAWTRDEGTAR